MKGFFNFRDVGGQFPELGRDLASGMSLAAFGVSDPQKYLIAALAEGRAVYIAADALSARRAQEAIFALSGKRCALLAAKDEVLTYRRALSKDAGEYRIRAFSVRGLPR